MAPYGISRHKFINYLANRSRIIKNAVKALRVPYTTFYYAVLMAKALPKFHNINEIIDLASKNSIIFISIFYINNIFHNLLFCKKNDINNSILE